MDKITICLWFDGNAREAAEFYTSLLPDSAIEASETSPGDNPSTRKGEELTVSFMLAGRRYLGLNGGPGHPFTDAISLQVDCADQAEVDRLWDALTADGGRPGPCGWLTDRFGVSWQIVPRRLPELLGSADRDGAERAMQAMLKMSKIDVAWLEAAHAGEPGWESGGDASTRR